MDKYSGVCYKNNYLASVICRIDFDEFISDKVFESSNLEKAISVSFNKREADQIIHINNVEVKKELNNPSEIFENNQTFIQKSFLDKTSLNHFVITKAFLYFEYKNYLMFEDFINSFNTILNELIKQQPTISLNRFGLRYINVFEKERIKLYKKYFKDAARELVNVKSTEDLPLSRAMVEYEYFFNEMRIMARCGKYNRHYPAELKTDDFVLDFDAYLEGSYACREIFPNELENAHSNIQMIFESMITDDLREILQHDK